MNFCFLYAIKSIECYKIHCVLYSPPLPQATRYSFLRDIASNTCFLVRKDCCKVHYVLLSPGSPVLNMVKYVVKKSAPIWCGQASRERITFYRSIVVRSCGHFQAASAYLRLSYCNSFERVCQEVSRMKIWDAVVKEKGGKNPRKSANNYKHIETWRLSCEYIDKRKCLCYNNVYS